MTQNYQTATVSRVLLEGEVGRGSVCTGASRGGSAAGLRWWLLTGVLLLLAVALAGPEAACAAGHGVIFSEGDGVFTNGLHLELRSKAKAGSVRYTLDGSEPGRESTLYTGPIAIEETTQVRARAFDGRGAAGDVVSRTYVVVEAALTPFNSNLPLVVAVTGGQEIGREERVPSAILFLGGEPGGDDARRTSLCGPVEIASRAWLNQRGRASTHYPKRSFTVKIVGEGDDFRNVPVLGMPKDCDWVLYGPYPDKTLMRDALAYELSNQLGRWAPRTRFVELFLQEHKGRLGPGDYVGVYVLMERVKRDANRIHVTRLDPDDNAGLAVTGGYVFKKDHSSRGMGQMMAPGYPPFEDATSRRTGYPTGPGGFPGDPAGFQPPFRGRTSSSSSSSSSSSRSSSSRSSRTGPVTNVIGAAVFPKRDVAVVRSVMIDEDGNEMVVMDDEGESLGTSFKTTVLTNRFYYVDPEADEITGVQRTWLMRHVESAERAIAGADFRSVDKGYAAYLDADSFIDYHLLVETTKNVDGFRFSTFYHLDRGGKIRMGPLWDWNLSFGNCNGKQGYMSTNWLWPQLDDREYTWFRRLFEDSDFGQRYVDRWAELRGTVFSTTNVLGLVDRWAAQLEEAQKRNFERWPILSTTIHPNWFLAESYKGEVDWMRDWIAQRLAWIDAQFVAAPTVQRTPTGALSLETAGAEVYFTTDGRDPRASGGVVAQGSQKFTEPVTLPAGSALLARARLGERWSAPRKVNAEK